MCDKIVSDVCLMNTMLGRKAVLGVEGEAIWDRDTVCVCVCTRACARTCARGRVGAETAFLDKPVTVEYSDE